MKDLLGKEISKSLINKDWRYKDYAASLGITENYLSMIIHGRRVPSWKLVRQMAIDLDLDLNRIVHESTFEIYTNGWGSAIL